MRKKKKGTKLVKCSSLSGDTIQKRNAFCEREKRREKRSHHTKTSILFWKFVARERERERQHLGFGDSNSETK